MSMKGHKFFIHKVETGFPRMPQLSKKNSINICCAMQRVLEQRIQARIKIKEGVNTGRKFQNPIMLYFVSNMAMRWCSGTTSAVLSRSSPNCQRIDLGMPVLLFLTLGWDQPNPPSKSAGTCCCRRTQWTTNIWIQWPFFCADPPPWSNSLDSPRLPSTWIVGAGRINFGRQAQGEWRSECRVLQIWGDDSAVHFFEIMIIWFVEMPSLEDF